MSRFLSSVSWAMSTIALALFVVATVAVPTQHALAEPGNCGGGCEPGYECINGVCTAPSISCLPYTTSNCSSGNGTDATTCGGYQCSNATQSCSCRWSSSQSTCWCP